MKIFKPAFLFCLIFNLTTCYAQDTSMDKAVEEIIALGKGAIIQLALELIDEKVEAQDFSNIKVMTDGRTVVVSFMNPIKYLPINSAFHFDFGVDLLQKVVTSSPVTNGDFDSDKKIPFYKPTVETKRNIQFVIDAINKSDEIGSIDPENLEDGMEIREHENYYSILVVSAFQESSYIIEKRSGKISDAEHAHLEPLPTFEDEDEFVEIK